MLEGVVTLKQKGKGSSICIINFIVPRTNVWSIVYHCVCRLPRKWVVMHAKSDLRWIFYCLSFNHILRNLWCNFSFIRSWRLHTQEYLENSKLIKSVLVCPSTLMSWETIFLKDKTILVQNSYCMSSEALDYFGTKFVLYELWDIFLKDQTILVQNSYCMNFETYF